MILFHRLRQEVLDALDIAKLVQQLQVRKFINPLKPDVWERLVLPRGGAQRHTLEINEGVSVEQDSLNTIFNTHKIRIVCKI